MPGKIRGKLWRARISQRALAEKSFGRPYRRRCRRGLPRAIFERLGIKPSDAYSVCGKAQDGQQQTAEKSSKNRNGMKFRHGNRNRIAKFRRISFPAKSKGRRAKGNLLREVWFCFVFFCGLDLQPEWRYHHEKTRTERHELHESRLMTQVCYYKKAQVTRHA